MRVTSAAALAALLQLGAAQRAPANAIDGRPYVLTGDVEPVHDPAIAREGNQYFVFGTDQGRVPPFLAFKCSPDLIAFKNCGHVFDAWPAWVRAAIPRASNIWAPDVSFFSGRWHLYYAVSTFGSQTSVIGLATSPTLDPTNASYAWRDEGLVLATNASLNYNAIDPALMLDAKGAAWLTLGSFWSGIKVVSINVTTGKISAGASVVAIATRPQSVGGAIEASFMVYQNNRYYLFTSWDKCCAGNASTYNVRVGRSDSPTGPFVDADGVGLLDGGGTYLIGHRANGWAAGGGQSVLRQAGPASGPNTIMILHAYEASNGSPWPQLVPLDWSGDWPVAT